MYQHLLVPIDGSELFERATEASLELARKVGDGRGVFGELLFGSHTKNLLARTRLPLLVLH